MLLTVLNRLRVQKTQSCVQAKQQHQAQPPPTPLSDMSTQHARRRRVQEGQLTQTVYCLLRDENYSEAIELLHLELQVCVCVMSRPGRRATARSSTLASRTHPKKHNNQAAPDARAALSLLGYCYFHTSQFDEAASMCVWVSCCFQSACTCARARAPSLTHTQKKQIKQ